MKKIIITYGIIAGTIVSAMLAISMPLYQKGTLNLDHGELLGYATMVVALSLIFFAVKSYRDNQLNGVISFGNGLKVGLLITLVAAVVYILTWEVIYQNLDESFFAKLGEYSFDKLKNAGATETELAEARQKMNDFNEMYKNPVVRAAVTLMEIAPVGIIISLLSAAVLRKKQFLPG
jgi:ethanolamine transporter EutH